MKLTRVVHPETTMAFGPLAELAPDIVASDDYDRPVDVALAFVDPDGECHIYLLAPEGLERLRRLISPIILPVNGSAE